MKRIPALAIMSGVTMLAFSNVYAAEPYPLDLRPDAPQCMMPEAKRPKLGADYDGTRDMGNGCQQYNSVYR